MQKIENGETSCSADEPIELVHIQEIITDDLLFGTTDVQEDRFQKGFANETEKQIEYLYRLLETARENMGCFFADIVIHLG
ncbi:MAG: hypothetical protein K2P73_06755 [Lachnospiraceae bacterium]|nr:hypothetical protein [Lachnospiraceae bacterium]